MEAPDYSSYIQALDPEIAAKFRSQFGERHTELADMVPLNSPLVVYVESSTLCNLECRFCPQHISPQQMSRQHMAESVFAAMLSGLKSLPAKPKLIRFCGTGESLLNHQFPDFVRQIVDSGTAERYELITNGILLGEDRNLPLAELLDRVIVSVNGLDEEQYRDVTLRKVKTDRLLLGLERFRDVIGRKSKIHIKAHNNIVPNVRAFKQFVEIFNGVADELYVENLVNLWPELESDLGQKTGHRFTHGDLNAVKACPQIFKSLQVNSDGSVVPCCIDWQAKNTVGHVCDNSLQDIWRGKELAQLQKRHLSGERFEFSPCKDCTMNEYGETDNLDHKLDVIAASIS